MSLTTDAAVVAAVAASRSRGEDRRQDRVTRAGIDRDREAARRAERRADLEAAALVRRDAERDREERRAKRAGERREACEKLGSSLSRWIAGHVTDLLFIPVISVPGMLAWTAMADYGQALYGTPGRALPAFSEGAMWAFDAAVEIIRHRDDRRREENPDAERTPVWHLQTGIAVFAGFGAALNFSHGLAGGSVITGVVMALISVAGVTARQIVTMTGGPRRTRAEKDAAKIAREIRKRELDTRLAAVRDATVQLDDQGGARLVYAVRPEPAGEDSRDRTSPAPDGDTEPAPVRRTRARTPGAPGGRTRARTPGAPGGRTRPHPGAVTDESAEVHFAAELADGQVPSQRRVKAELHVGQDRAAQICAHLAAVAAASPTPGSDAAGTAPDDTERTTAP